MCVCVRILPHVSTGIHKYRPQSSVTLLYQAACKNSILVMLSLYVQVKREKTEQSAKLGHTIPVSMSVWVFPIHSRQVHTLNITKLDITNFYLKVLHREHKESNFFHGCWWISSNGSLTCEEQTSHVHSQAAKCLKWSPRNSVLISQMKNGMQGYIWSHILHLFSFPAKIFSWSDICLKTDVKSHSFSL